MDIKSISHFLLEIFYALVGLLMLITSFKTFQDKKHKTRLGTSLFWCILAIIFIFGSIIPPVIIGTLLLILGVLSASKQVNIGSLKGLNKKFSKTQSEKLGNKIFIPSITLAIVALIIAQFTKLSGTVAIGIASITAILVSLFITKSTPITLLEDGDRMLQSVGSTGIFPQLLAAVGSLFTVAGVGNVISNSISGFIPQGNILIGISAYCIGMALFTMIMGNAFAAFSVITAGIGLPFVFAQGANPAVAGALGLTAGYCGTLLTPMAANFNILPTSLLELKNKNSIIKYQIPIGIILLLLHIPLMYFLAF